MAGEITQRLGDNDYVEISGPLEFRRLFGDARCQSCKEAGRDCLLEKREKSKGGIHCYSCNSAAKCQFRRVFVKEADAAAFTWEELTDTSTVFASGTNNVSKNQPQMPPPRSPQVGPSNIVTSQIPSTVSEPPSGSGIATALKEDSNPRHSGMISYDSSRWSLSGDNMGAVFGHSYTNSIYNTNSRPFHPEFSTELNDRTERMKIMEDILDQVERDVSAVPEELPRFTSDKYVNPPQYSEINASDSGSSRSFYNNMDKPFKCSACSKTFTHRNILEKHAKRHERNFECEAKGCHKQFGTRNDLDRHRKSVHSLYKGLPTWVCPIPDCKSYDKSWGRKDNFKAHVSRMHPDVNIDKVVEDALVQPTTPPHSRNKHPPYTGTPHEAEKGQPNTKTPRVLNWSTENKQQQLSHVGSAPALKDILE